MNDELYVHSEGFGDLLLCYNKVISCGSDGDIRVVYLPIGIGDVMDISVSQKKLYCIAMDYNDPEKVYVGSGDFCVYAVNLVIPVQKSVSLRFTSSVYAIASDYSGKWLAAGSADFYIKMVSLPYNESSVVCNLFEHTAPILSLIFTPDNLILVSSSCDGTAILWNTKSHCPIHKLSNLIPFVSDIDIAKSILRLSFSPKLSYYGYILCIPQLCSDICNFDDSDVSNISVANKISSNLSSSITLISTKQFNTIINLNGKEKSILSPPRKIVFQCSSWSTDGNFLAAGTDIGCVIIWRYTDKLCDISAIHLFNHPLKESVLSISSRSIQSENNMELALFTKGGCLIYYESISFDFQTSNYRETDVISIDEIENNISQQHLPQDCLSNNSFTEENSADKIRNDEKNLIITSCNKKRKFDSEFNVDFPFYNDNIKDFPSKISELENKVSLFSECYIPQDPFQCSSWPRLLSNWKHLCLCFNLVGKVMSHQEEINLSTSEKLYLVEIEFHDKRFHHSIQISDSLGFSLAFLDLKKIVLVYRGQSSQECTINNCLNTSGGVINAIIFSSGDGNTEWSQRLQSGELCYSVVATDCCIAILTSFHYIRTFGISGTQFEIIFVPGIPITLCSNITNFVAFYHRGIGFRKNQCISFINYLTDIGSRPQVIQTADASLSSESELRWSGMTCGGLIAILDSNFSMQVFCPSIISGRNFINPSGLWFPVLDLKPQCGIGSLLKNVNILGITFQPESSSDVFNLSQEEVRYNLLNKDELQSFSSNPQILRVKFISPVCQYSHSEKSKFESDYQISSVYRENSTSQEKLLRLFALSSKSGHHNLALEVCYRMNCSFLKLALTYADKMNLLQLCESIKSISKFDNLKNETDLNFTDIEIKDTNTVFVTKSIPNLSQLSPENKWSESKNYFEQFGARTNLLLNPSKMHSPHSNPFMLKSQFSSINTPTSTINKEYLNSFMHTNQKKQLYLNNKNYNIHDESISTHLYSNKFLSETPDALNLTEELDTVHHSNSINDTNFKSWFNENQTYLKKLYPNVSHVDLIRNATKIWRENN